MSNLFDKLQAIAANLVTGGATGSGSTQSSGAANSSNNEVSVFNRKEESATKASTQIDDEEYLWWQERLEEKKEEEEKAKTESFDSSKYSSDEWTSVEAKANKNILGNVKDYTFKTSSGTKIDLEDIEGVKILENKQTGEIVVVGANGATINAGNKDAKITIYDSDIKKLDTDKGNDEVKIYNSNVGEITTGRGIDNVLIENSQVEKVNTGSGSDSVKVKDSSIGNANTSSSLLWGVFDDAEDTVTLVNSEADKIKTGRGNDNVIASDSNVEKLKTGSGSDSLSLDKTEVDKLRTNKKDTVVEDKNYLDIDKTKLLELGTDKYIDAGNGNQFTVSSYSGYLLSQEVGFETEEEYQEYVLESLTSNFETMKSVFDVQEGKDGWIAGGYNGLKELTGLGITDKDVEEMIAKQEEMIKGLTAAMNGEGDMTFEEAYEFYTGTTYSKEKIDKYMEVSNIYSAMMVGCQYDENYMEEFEAATGMSVEDVTKEYALCQLDTFGKSTGLQDLVEKYSQDQEGFADKLSAAITTVGMTCIVVGAVVSFVFPPAAPVGAALMTAGKYVSLGGMFVDNAMDLVDDTTDKDGLTKEELSENALETGVEVVSYATGRAIGGLTNNINTAVSSAATQAGASNVTSYIAGQAAETTADMILSLGADYAIAQGQSLITTGEFMDSSEYWSLDRFLGEGKNQLIGILTGLSSAKINNSSGQAAVYATAGKMVLDGDSTGARAYLETSGVKVDDTSFDDFQRTVIEANPDASLPRLEAPKENNDPEIEVDKPVEEGRGFVFNPETGELTPKKPKTESQREIIELDHPASGDNIGVNLRVNTTTDGVDVQKVEPDIPTKQKSLSTIIEKCPNIEPEKLDRISEFLSDKTLSRIAASKNIEAEIDSVITKIESFKTELSKITTDENISDLLTSFIFKTGTWVDSDAQVDITRRQLTQIAEDGATTENTYILAPQPKGAKELKSYTNAARDMIQISDNADGNLKLNANNAGATFDLSKIDGDAKIIISDDCSVSGASMIEDTINALNVSGDVNGQKTIYFAPTVLGTKASSLLTSFTECFSKITPDEMDNLVKVVNANGKGLDTLSDNAKQMYEILRNATDGKEERFKKVTSQMQKIVATNSVQFKLIEGTKAEDYRETVEYKALSKAEQEQIDAYMSGFGQSFGYHDCNTSIAIEGYNGGDYEFGVEAGNKTAINALGIGRNDLPTKGNAPNNNNILAQIFAKSVGVDSSRIKISGHTTTEIYFEVAKNGYTTNPKIIDETGKEISNTYRITLDMKKDKKFTGKYNVCGQEFTEGETVVLSYKNSDGKICSFEIELPIITKDNNVQNPVQVLVDSLVKTNTDNSDSDYMLVRGTEVKGYRSNEQTLIDGQRDQFIFAFPNGATDIKIEKKQN